MTPPFQCSLQGWAERGSCAPVFSGLTQIHRSSQDRNIWLGQLLNHGHPFLQAQSSETYESGVSASLIEIIVFSKLFKIGLFYLKIKVIYREFCCLPYHKWQQWIDLVQVKKKSPEVSCNFLFSLKKKNTLIVLLSLLNAPGMLFPPGVLAPKDLSHLLLLFLGAFAGSWIASCTTRTPTGTNSWSAG